MATGITETDVWGAADALLLEGARPTIERVRQKIGRGSPNTVSPHLETWFRALGSRIKDPGAFVAAPAVPDPVAQAAAHFWEAAMAEARDEQARAYRERWEDLAQEGERLAADAEQLQLREAGVAQREQDLQHALKVATSQLAAAEERLQAAELQVRQRDEQLEQHRLQLADARGVAQALLADAEKSRGQHAQALDALEARHAAHERRWLNELDGERGAAKRLQARLDEAQAAGQQQLAEARKALSDEQERRRRAEEGAASLRAEAQEALARHESELAAARSDAEAAADRERAVETRLAAAESRGADFLAQLKSKDEQLSELARHLMALTAAGAGRDAQADPSAR